MKKLFILFAAATAGLAACKSNSNNGLSSDIVQNGKTPKMAFEQTVHDFGTITEGEIVSTTFDFTNTGDGDLIISDAKASCGCTIPEWPKEVIHPGGKGEIKVKFDSQGKANGNEKVIKVVTITANTNPKFNKIQIEAIVNKAPDTK